MDADAHPPGNGFGFHSVKVQDMVACLARAVARHAQRVAWHAAPSVTMDGHRVRAAGYADPSAPLNPARAGRTS